MLYKHARRDHSVPKSIEPYLGSRPQNCMQPQEKNFLSPSRIFWMHHFPYIECSTSTPAITPCVQRPLVQTRHNNPLLQSCNSALQTYLPKSFYVWHWWAGRLLGHLIWEWFLPVSTLVQFIYGWNTQVLRNVPMHTTCFSVSCWGEEHRAQGCWWHRAWVISVARRCMRKRWWGERSHRWAKSPNRPGGSCPALEL